MASLSNIFIPDLLQVILGSGKAGRITITHAGATSRLWFADREVIDAESGSLTGEAAVSRVLGLHRGELVADFAPVRRTRTVWTPAQELLLRAAARDEGRAVLPGHESQGSGVFAPGDGLARPRDLGHDAPDTISSVFASRVAPAQPRLGRPGARAWKRSLGLIALIAVATFALAGWYRKGFQEAREGRREGAAAVQQPQPLSGPRTRKPSHPRAGQARGALRVGNAPQAVGKPTPPGPQRPQPPVEDETSRGSASQAPPDQTSARPRAHGAAGAQPRRPRARRHDVRARTTAGARLEPPAAPGGGRSRPATVTTPDRPGPLVPPAPRPEARSPDLPFDLEIIEYHQPAVQVVD